MSNIVHLFAKASDDHKQERANDWTDRRLLTAALAAAAVGILLFGAVCFDIGLRIGSSLS